MYYSALLDLCEKSSNAYFCNIFLCLVNFNLYQNIYAVKKGAAPLK